MGVTGAGAWGCSSSPVALSGHCIAGLGMGPVLQATLKCFRLRALYSRLLNERAVAAGSCLVVAAEWEIKTQMFISSFTSYSLKS